MQFQRAIIFLCWLLTAGVFHAEEDRVTLTMTNVPVSQVFNFYRDLTGEVIVVSNAELQNLNKPITLRTETPLSRADARKFIEAGFKSQAGIKIQHFELEDALEFNRVCHDRIRGILSVRLPQVFTNLVSTNDMRIQHRPLPEVKKLYETLSGTQVECDGDSRILINPALLISIDAGQQPKTIACQLLELTLGVQADILMERKSNEITVWRSRFNKRPPKTKDSGK